tara:strand:+ start:458 stop:1300 length:843 start_codon:yes stop_codon:yes gene_type:complete
MEQLHPLMQSALRSYLKPKAGQRVWSALRLPLLAAKFLMQHPKLWPWAIAPALINLLVFVATLFLTLPAASSGFGGLWAMPEIVAWYDYGLIALWGIVYLLVMVLTVILSYMGAMMIGGVIASPFNDKLSEETEKILLGDLFCEIDGGSFLPSLLKSMASSAVVAGMYFAIMAPMLLLHLIPGVGSVAYTLIGGVVGGYFVALEYSDTLLERRRTPFRMKLGRVWQERPFTVGFGVGTSLMLAIPVVNFFCLPIAVIAGTAVGTALLEEPPGEAPDALPE